MPFPFTFKVCVAIWTVLARLKWGTLHHSGHVWRLRHMTFSSLSPALAPCPITDCEDFISQCLIMKTTWKRSSCQHSNGHMHDGKQIFVILSYWHMGLVCHLLMIILYCASLIPTLEWVWVFKSGKRVRIFTQLLT